MKEFHVCIGNEGQRLDRFMGEVAHWPRPLVMRAIRTKKLKVNGKKVEPSYRLQSGDMVTSYVLEEEGKQRDVSIVYEDAHILVADKPAGLLCMDVTGKEADTLIARVNTYLSQKGEEGFLIHRIDFHTSGLVLVAKDRESEQFLNEKIKKREIHKEYVCIVRGILRPNEGTLTHQLFKDAKRKRVFLSAVATKGSKTAVLQYRTIATSRGLSLVSCLLVTGRTHQIRSQMAYVGHPLIGDDKYGSKTVNRTYGEKGQLLRAAVMRFDFLDDRGICGYLQGMRVEGKTAWFIQKYFPSRIHIHEKVDTI